MPNPPLAALCVLWDLKSGLRFVLLLLQVRAPKDDGFTSVAKSMPRTGNTPRNLEEPSQSPGLRA